MVPVEPVDPATALKSKVHWTRALYRRLRYSDDSAGLMSAFGAGIL